MKLKYDFVVNNVAGETVAVSVGDTADRFNGYIKLNETAAFIFGLLKNDISRDEIVASVLKKYPDATMDTACESVDELLEKLSTAGLLV